MFQFMKSAFQPFCKQKPATTRKTTRRGVRPCLEALEGRDVPSGGIGFHDGVVYIWGTSQRDDVYVYQLYSDLGHWNSTVVEMYHEGHLHRAEFDRSQVRGLVFNGYEGNDYFNNNTWTPSEAYGGYGDDELYGGYADDVLVGGLGIDALYGRYGNDRLHGGDYGDFLYGGEGNDEIYGGDGDDRIYAGSGDDRLYGESGNDYLLGEDGFDLLIGGYDDDYLDGGRGWSDHLYGGPGADRFVQHRYWWWGWQNEDHIADFRSWEGDSIFNINWWI